MLKDYLIQVCQDDLENSCAGECEDCNNKNNCCHDCSSCLNQVHFYPRFGGRSDYDCPNLLLNYVLRYTVKYSSQIASALQCIDLSSYPEYNIFSMGCGAAPDLMAFEEFAVNTNKGIYYKGYDHNPLWSQIHGYIEQYVSNEAQNIRAKLLQRDIFEVFEEGKPRHRQYNVVVIQYLLSHLYNYGRQGQISDLFDAIVANILPHRTPDSPFLIIITDIDTYHKGRGTWSQLLNKLEDSGYHGHAIARSFYPGGDLGLERWCDYSHRQSPVFGNISYEYIQNDSEHDGAQLIIELG